MTDKLIKRTEGKKVRKTISMKNLINKYHIWDARKISQLLPNEKLIDVTITSPPYWHLKDYGVESQIGFGQTYDQYLDDLEKVFQNIYFITKKKGSLWIVIDTFKRKGEMKILPFDLITHLKSVGWKLQDIVIWLKNKNLPWSHKGKLRNIFEYILFFTKDREFKFYVERIKDPRNLQKWWVRYPERYGFLGKVPERLWYIPIPTQGSWSDGWVKHFCPLPPMLVERILLLTTNEKNVVLDPFAGSGIVLAQALVMKRKPIGFDLNENYKKMYENKVLPFIENSWRDRRKELIGIQRKCKNFASIIKTLRQLKYTKVLSRKTIKQNFLDSSIINTIFLIGNKESTSPHIFFILEDDVNLDIQLSSLDLITTKPPLSKYGLDPHIKLVTRSEFIRIYRKRHFPRELFLYTKGNTHYYKRKLCFTSWMEESTAPIWREYSKAQVPVLVSNLKIRIKMPETKGIQIWQK